MYSTVNVRHLEQLGDRLTELTGIRVRGTLPESILTSADAVVMVDVDPQTLIERLVAGKVYPSERVHAAFNNFFKLETLAALCEAALKQVAETIQAQRLPSESPAARGTSTSSSPRRSASACSSLSTPCPGPQRVVRRAWRSAQRLGAELDLVWVADHEPVPDEREQIGDLRQLAGVLGAHLLIEPGYDVVTVTRRRRPRARGNVHPDGPAQACARNQLPRGTTLARPSARRLPGIDLRIVSDRTSQGAYPRPRGRINSSRASSNL